MLNQGVRPATELDTLKLQIASIIGCTFNSDTEIEVLALRKRVAELEEVNQTQLDFLNTASHELRSPLANMSIAIKMINNALGSLENHLLSTTAQANLINVVRYIQILEQECDRETALVNDLLDLEGAKAGNQDGIPQSIYFPAFLERIVHPFKLRAQEREQVLEVYCNTDVTFFKSYSSNLERIFAELLNNACKYTPTGERIVCSLGFSENDMRIQVRNTGVEISAYDMSRIFEEFYRGRNVVGDRRGSGLGLALVKKLVLGMSGSIWAESDEVSTRFNICIPVKIEDRVSKLLNAS